MTSHKDARGHGSPAGRGARTSESSRPRAGEPEDPREPVDAIVVGSGFGGAVAAARLAQAGFSVVVLERGRRWRPGGFPRSAQLQRDWLWEDDRGLYDLRWLDSMLALQAAGWGGGSLVYANVFARPAAGTLDDRWAPELRRERLDPYYDLAGTMLEVAPVQQDPATGQVPARTNLIEHLVQRMRIQQATVRPNLAVRFGDPEQWTPNAHGVPQRGCAFVGECIAGCNRSAKNSLDHNYLAVAERHGARAVTGAEVRRIAPGPAGWSVWTAEGEGSALVRRTATRVFLAAGAVATTELLLRARDLHGTLLDLSPTLGQSFSANGDYLSLGNLRRGAGDLTTGPTITTTTVLDVWEKKRPVWFQVQDGAVPAVISDLVDGLLPWPTVRERWRRLRRRDPRRTVAFLSMGHDAGTGLLDLDEHGAARLRWQNRWQSRLYRAEGRVGAAVSRILGAPVRAVLSWSFFRKPVTVHPLGGVPTGPDRRSGVVDVDGQVHGYPGLYVVDGSAIPASTGVNPSATILARAERAMEAVVREWTDDPRWRAPEWARTRPVPVPEDDAYAWMARRRRETAGDGVVLDEGMRERRPRGARGGGMQVRLEIPGHDDFAADPEHRLTVTGQITLPDVPGTHAVDGTLRMFPRHGRYLMRYDLRFADDEGRTWTGVGIKRQRGRGPIARYRGLTRIDLNVRRDDDPGVAARTVLILHPDNVLRNGLTIRGTGFTRLRRLRAYLAFARFFGRGVLGSHPRRDVTDDTSIDPE